MQGMQVRSLGQEDPREKGSWQPTPVFSPVKSHGQRSLVGYIPWGHKELDIPEHAPAKKKNKLFFPYVLSYKKDKESCTQEKRKKKKPLPPPR